MQPRAKLRMLLIVSVAFIACLIVSGCNKQQKQASAAKMPQVGKETAPAADTADIFKEFYSEDSSKSKAGAKGKKLAKQETFSPSSSSGFQPEFSKGGRYTVQITCVRSKSFAESMTGKMKDKGYPAYVSEVQNPTPNLSGAFYRVRIGGFDGFSAAKAFCENILTPSGYQYWIDKKSNDNVGMEGYGLGSGTAGGKAAGSYDNAVPATGTGYQSAPSTEPTSSTESSAGSSYSSPSSTTPSASSSQSTYQAPATTSPAPAAGSASTAPAASSMPANSPAPSATSSPSTAPASASSSSAASTAPAATSSGSPATSTGTTSGKTGAGGSAESGWGTDSSSKSGW